jgi:hypothetical protein
MPFVFPIHQSTWDMSALFHSYRRCGYRVYWQAVSHEFVYISPCARYNCQRDGALPPVAIRAAAECRGPYPRAGGPPSLAPSQALRQPAAARAGASLPTQRRVGLALDRRLFEVVWGLARGCRVEPRRARVVSRRWPARTRGACWGQTGWLLPPPQVAHGADLGKGDI